MNAKNPAFVLLYLGPSMSTFVLSIDWFDGSQNQYLKNQVQRVQKNQVQNPKKPESKNPLKNQIQKNQCPDPKSMNEATN